MENDAHKVAQRDPLQHTACINATRRTRNAGEGRCLSDSDQQVYTAVAQAPFEYIYIWREGERERPHYADGRDVTEVVLADHSEKVQTETDQEQEHHSPRDPKKTYASYEFPQDSSFP